MALTFGAATSDRVDLGSGLDNINAFTVLIWVFLTTHTNGRALFSKGASNVKALNLAATNAVDFGVIRATTNASAQGANGIQTLNDWVLWAFTYDETDGPRIFKGLLTSGATEVAYAARTVGVGAETDDSDGAWKISNFATANSSSVQGRIARIAHFQRRFALAEILRWQFQPFTDADCDIYMELGFNGADTQPNWTTLGAGINGTVTGATVGSHVPLGPPFGLDAIWTPSAAGVTETPTPGGGIAGGTAPLALVIAGTGGATAAGAAPSPQAAVTVGGGLAQGLAPSAAASAQVGGALAAGAGPVANALAESGGGPASGFAANASAAVVAGGATSSGTGGTVLVGVTPGGAVSGGNAPSAPLIETPTPGGAVAGGAGPSAGAVAGQGGSPASGFSVNASTAVTPGGVTAVGIGGAAVATISAGGAVAGGIAPSEIGAIVTQFGVVFGGDSSRFTVPGGDEQKAGVQGGDLARGYASGGDRRSD